MRLSYPSSIEVNNRLKIKGKKLDENNPTNGFQDIVWKQNTDALPDMVMTIIPAPTSWAGDKND